MGWGITSTLPLISYFPLYYNVCVDYCLGPEWGRRHDNHYAKKVICRASAAVGEVVEVDGCGGIWHHQKRIENRRNSRGAMCPILLFCIIHTCNEVFLGNYTNLITILARK